MTLVDPSKLSVREIATSGVLALTYAFVTFSGITWWKDLGVEAVAEQKPNGEMRVYTLAAFETPGITERSSCVSSSDSPTRN